MHPKLKNITVDEYTGMRVGLVALLIALIGAALGFTIAPGLGYWVAATGILLGLVAAVLHWYKNWRSIFHIDRE